MLDFIRTVNNFYLFKDGNYIYPLGGYEQKLPGYVIFYSSCYTPYTTARIAELQPGEGFIFISNIVIADTDGNLTDEAHARIFPVIPEGDYEAFYVPHIDDLTASEFDFYIPNRNMSI